ncbi:hypothetical protein [Burkholderia cepacia]|nr:hypothetical protein [Burkholderia cepacia]
MNDSTGMKVRFNAVRNEANETAHRFTISRKEKARSGGLFLEIST